MGKVRFFCDCGKEIWQDMSRADKETLSIAAAEEGAKCANCFLQETRKGRGFAEAQQEEKYPGLSRVAEEPYRIAAKNIAARDGVAPEAQGREEVGRG